MTGGPTLRAALGVAPDEVVALVGGGGKTTAMFRLAREVAAAGGRVIITTTTHIFATQVGLAPAHLLVDEAKPDDLRAALEAHRQVLVTGPENPQNRRVAGLSLERFSELRRWCPDACVINEADGSRTLPFKAPAAHEPAIPAETTLVLPVVGADIFGKPLTEDRVHRPERVAMLSGAALGVAITPEIVARVLAHPEGGRKGVPPGARVCVLINKVASLPDPSPARETAERLLREPAIDAVLLTSVRDAEPVLEIFRR
ncbi:MAG TPA: selenium cofactor biosynthesis protein YqeC [Methylomirabilota bacterium]|nr:selenium cofactor biosynthesis protein YqeC [Methylomirabilota bacterium]